VVSFGRATTSAARASVEAPPIPDWLRPVRDRAAEFAGLPPAAFAHLLINEYREGAPIGWHRDRPVFDKVVGVSLKAPTVMRFRRRVGRAVRADQRAAAAALGLPAGRTGAPRLGAQPAGGEAHRYSLTFRTCAGTDLAVGGARLAFTGFAAGLLELLGFRAFQGVGGLAGLLLDRRPWR
jgi:hypothetical protein